MKYAQVEGGLLVEQVCRFDGKLYQHVVKNATVEQLFDWRNGAYIQDAMPNTTAEDREFLISGLTPGRWEELFGEEA